MRRSLPILAVTVLALGLSAMPRSLVSRVSTTGDFVHFESEHVHPLAMTPDGTRLLAVNTPDNRLSVFDLTGAVPALIAEIPVGMEPVSVAAFSDDEAWVVNTLSDDVSVVNLTTLHVRATLRVGDEPGDVVFAGAASPGPGPLAYVSVSQEDAVKVYHPGTLAQVATIPINGRMPRALARTPDLARVYVAVLHAGNRTSILSANEVGIGAPPPNPPLRVGLPPPPPAGLIIQQQNGVWRDEAGVTNWNSAARYTLFDVDVAQINTATQAVADTFSDIGSTNFGLAASPSGKVAVTAIAARNLKRFEPNLRGHITDTRAAVITAAGSVTPIELNPTINYSTSPGPPSDHAVAIGLPVGVAWSDDDATLLVTALANNRIARVSESGAILARAPTVAGPTGVLVDGPRGRVYVLGRFHQQLQTLNQSTLSPLATSRIGMDPTPDAIVNGRKFFYGGFTSGHGDQACASCHLSGDFDNLAWDLGDPQGDMQPIDRTGMLDPLIDAQVHPMKGPMTTQSLRGLPNTGMLHWRADRANLSAFNPAFVGLMGRATALPDSEMTAFIDFTTPLAYPPNPNQFLDRSLRDAPIHQPSAKRGSSFFFNQPVAGGLTCNNCHAATNFGPGTNGQIINNLALQEPQDMKIPQLRNLYKKTGFTEQIGALNKRGFGFTHDGAIDNLFNFLQFPGFNFGSPATQTPNENRRDVEAFMLAFDTGMAPAVGAQVTFFGANNGTPSAVARMDTLRAQAALGFCELVAKGRVGGVPRGWLYQGADLWKPDRQSEPAITSLALRSLGGPGSEVTVTGVPPGSGARMGIDRDRDTFLDGDERAAGSDPGNPGSTPLNVGVGDGPGRDAYGLRSVRPNPFGARTEIGFALARPGSVDCTVHDVLGRQVRVIARGQVFEAGAHVLPWDGRRDDGRDAATGVYLVRLAAGEGRWSRVVIKVR